jgi:hypothetical protein
LGSKRVFWHETRTKHAAAGTAQGAKLHSPKQNTRFINFRRDSGSASERGLFGASFRLELYGVPRAILAQSSSFGAKHAAAGRPAACWKTSAAACFLPKHKL